MDGSDELERSEAAQRQASDELRQRVEERAADLRSVDESLQREAAQRQRSEERFRNIFEYSNDAILVLDPDHDEILGNLTLGARPLYTVACAIRSMAAVA